MIFLFAFSSFGMAGGATKAGQSFVRQLLEDFVLCDMTMDWLFELKWSLLTWSY